MTETKPRVRWELADRIATVTIDRPEKLNALDAATLDELEAVVGALEERDDVGGVVLTGAGEKAFVAGADIAELAQLDARTGTAASRRGQAVFRRIETSRKVWIAAVRGYALGGGCELALACHLRVAGQNARFGLPEVKLGILPGYGGTVRLARLVGRGRALELLLTGEPIDAAEAHRIGLVNRVVPDDQVLEAARAWLGGILRNGPLALALVLETSLRAQEMALDDALAWESYAFGLLAASDDMREGMRAFLEKRPPRFAGR